MVEATEREGALVLFFVSSQSSRSMQTLKYFRGSCRHGKDSALAIIKSAEEYFHSQSFSVKHGEHQIVSISSTKKHTSQ